MKKQWYFGLLIFMLAMVFVFTGCEGASPGTNTGSGGDNGETTYISKIITGENGTGQVVTITFSRDPTPSATTEQKLLTLAGLLNGDKYEIKVASVSDSAGTITRSGNTITFLNTTGNNPYTAEIVSASDTLEFSTGEYEDFKKPDTSGSPGNDVPSGLTIGYTVVGRDINGKEITNPASADTDYLEIRFPSGVGLSLAASEIEISNGNGGQVTAKTGADVLKSTDSTNNVWQYKISVAAGGIIYVKVNKTYVEADKKPVIVCKKSDTSPFKAKVSANPVQESGVEYAADTKKIKFSLSGSVPSDFRPDHITLINGTGEVEKSAAAFENNTHNLLVNVKKQGTIKQIIIDHPEVEPYIYSDSISVYKALPYQVTRVIKNTTIPAEVGEPFNVELRVYYKGTPSDNIKDNNFTGSKNVKITGVPKAPGGTYGTAGGTDIPADPANSDIGTLTLPVTFNQGISGEIALVLHAAAKDVKDISFTVEGVEEGGNLNSVKLSTSAIMLTHEALDSLLVKESDDSGVLNIANPETAHSPQGNPVFLVQPKVKAVDKFKNPIAGLTVKVALTVPTPNTKQLGGGRTQTTGNDGYAVFTDLKIKSPVPLTNESVTFTVKQTGPTITKTGTQTFSYK